MSSHKAIRHKEKTIKTTSHKSIGKRTVLAALLFTASALAVAQSSQAAKNEALFKAAKSGTAADIRAAIKAGADVNAREGILAMTPLMYAAECNEDPDAVKALLEAGASVNARSNTPWCPNSAFLRAASYNINPDVVKTLIDAGANGKDDALVYAASCNQNPDVIKVLLNAGANVNYVKGNFASVDLETGEAEPRITFTIFGEDATPEGAVTALMCAAGFNANPAVLKVLLDAGADVNATDQKGTTALMYAVAFSWNPDVIKLLLDVGADVNAKINGVNGDESILIWAVRNNASFDVIKALIDAGADVYTKTESGSVLMYDVLYNKNADVNLIKVLATSAKETPSSILLNALRSSWNREFNISPDAVKALIDAGADVNTQDVLIAAVNNDNANADVVKVLIDAGADVNQSDDEGQTVLMRILRYNSNLDEGKVSKIKTLIDRGANVNAKGAGNSTALMVAAISSTNPDTVQALVNAGADVKMKDKAGKRAIDYLEMRKDTDVEFAKTDAYRKMKELLH